LPEPASGGGDNNDGSSKDLSGKGVLTGTTLKVYRLLYKEGKPLGVHEIQREIGLGSASVAHFHLTKLVENGLVQQKDGGYVVDKIMFENMLRIRRSLIPVQTTFAIFFATTLACLLTILRPVDLSSGYVFGVIVNCIAVGIFSYQSIFSLRSGRKV